MKKILLNISYGFITLTLSSTLLWSHGDQTHEKISPAITSSIEKPSILSKDIEVSPKVPTYSKEKSINKTYQEINLSYLSDIKPIFEKKCFDCHGVLKRKPWYFDLPGISYMIQKDIKESKKHMDIGKDFPFISHETPYNDLKSIRKIAQEGGMPPLKYILGHWDAKLTNNEKQKLLKWSEDSMLLIDDFKLSSEE